MRRAWRRLRATQQGHASARIVSYNILADGARLALSPKHGYCPLELREWPGRCLRLARETAEYEADIICLQECSLRAFAQLQEGMNRAVGGPAYQGVHSSQCVHEYGSHGEKKRCACASVP
jgi:mRNA deadenylase 3'-5' endonuclease subunit Ccr4